MIKLKTNHHHFNVVIPEELDSTQQQLKAVLDQSVEKLSLESKVRIENYKKEEERKLQDFAAQAKLENTYLLHRLIRIRDEEKGQQKEKKEAKEGPRVRFNEKIDDDDNIKKTRNTGFALDEHQMKGLDNKISVQPTLRDGDDTDEEGKKEGYY
jgi:hypothetical protein